MFNVNDITGIQHLLILMQLCVSGKAMRNEDKNRAYFDNYLELVIKAYSVFENQVNTLLTGSITVRVLKVIQVKKDAFIDVCNTFKTDLVTNLPRAGWKEESMKDHLELVLAQRQQELEFLQQYRNWAGELKTLCNGMEGGRKNCTCLQIILNHFISLSTCHIV